VLLAVFWRLGVQHWLAVYTGSSNTPGTPPNYNFNSGFGSILIPLAVQLAVFGAAFWWHNQCHVDGCYWYARRKTAAAERACWKHHPHQRRTVEDIHAAHHAAKATAESEAK
jgi:hypothetical protein